jgi:hypothetical protein
MFEIGGYRSLDDDQLISTGKKGIRRTIRKKKYAKLLKLKSTIDIDRDLFFFLVEKRVERKAGTHNSKGETYV